jgi:hypothetical protein
MPTILWTLQVLAAPVCKIVREVSYYMTLSSSAIDFEVRFFLIVFVNPETHSPIVYFQVL